MTSDVFKLIDDRPLPSELRKSRLVLLKGKPTRMVIVLENGRQKLVPLELEEESEVIRCRCHHYNGNGGRCSYSTCNHTPDNHWGFNTRRRFSQW